MGWCPQEIYGADPLTGAVSVGQVMGQGGVCGAGYRVVSLGQPVGQTLHWGGVCRAGCGADAPGAAFPHAGAGPIPTLPELLPALPGPARTYPCPCPALTLPYPSHSLPAPCPCLSRSLPVACARPSPSCPGPVGCHVLAPPGAAGANPGTFRRDGPPRAQPLTQGRGCRDPPGAHGAVPGPGLWQPLPSP